MRLGIDASNIRAGGGVIHLKKILEHADLLKHDIHQVIVWDGKNTLEKLSQIFYVGLQYLEVLDYSFSRRLLWQQMELCSLAKNSCDILNLSQGDYI